MEVKIAEFFKFSLDDSWELKSNGFTKLVGSCRLIFIVNPVKMQDIPPAGDDEVVKKELQALIGSGGEVLEVRTNYYNEDIIGVSIRFFTNKDGVFYATGRAYIQDKNESKAYSLAINCIGQYEEEVVETLDRELERISESVTPLNF